jgi:ribosomal protein S18 acetylase RimI-like enzyme
MEIKDGKNYIAQVKELIAEYANRLNRDLSFQQIDAELSDPTAKYTAPEGEILVAVNEKDTVVGMVAYHRHNPERCEMKRLYVKPEVRGMHLGDTLVKEIIKRAHSAGYTEMVLDTVAPLKAAINLYRRNGFIECEPYYDNPMDDVIYMIKHL